MPYVPEALPRIIPEASFETSSEHATCSRVPSEKPSLPDSSRAATCPRMPLRENPSGSRLSLPPVPSAYRTPPGSPECAARPASVISPEASESATCPASMFPRAHGGYTAYPDFEPELQTTRMPPDSLANHPRKTLPGTGRMRRVSIIPGTTLLFIIENSRKWLQLQKFIEIRFLIRKIPIQ